MLIDISSRQYYNKKINNAYIYNPIYPNCIVNNNNPYDEQIMSIPNFNYNMKEINNDITTYNNGIYFFFIYNLDNYYHFIYDTLPYLIHYFELNENNIKILIPEKYKLLQFHLDTFNILNIPIDNIICADNNSIYEQLYIPSSLTHGCDKDYKLLSHLPPSNKAYDIWNMLKYNAIYKTIHTTYPKKIYISRRSWKHNDFSNIGTNYTTRRKCINEDDIVELLDKYGFAEIFCENMSMVDKINMFNNATHIIGFIGGGMCNLLFSNKHIIVGCINTPDFLNINNRFKYSMNHTNITYLDITSHSQYNGPYPLYTRVRIIDTSSEYYNKIGEIEEYINNSYNIKILDKPSSGFILNNNYLIHNFTYSQIKNIDNGLNSPFICDINGLRKYLYTMHKE